MDFFNKIFRGDRVIWMIFLFLCLISIVEVYSASSILTYKTDYWKPILRHSLFLIVGMGIVLGIHAIPPKFFSIIGILLPIMWILLAVTLFMGQINDSSRWLVIGGASFQPSEFAKLCLIVFAAFMLSKHKEDKEDQRFRWIIIATAITCALIFKENGSTAILLFVVIYLMMLIGQIPWKKMWKLTLIVCCIGGIFTAFLLLIPMETLQKKPYNITRFDTWKSRIESFSEKKVSVRDPEFKIYKDKGQNHKDNYQESHSKIAIANGGIVGKMPGNSVERDFLPQAFSDFIYAIIIEETGLAGGFCILLFYVILLIRAGFIANRSEKLFPKFVVMGAALLLFIQALTNMAVAVGLIPVTGQTLPLISRGGTSIWVTCVYFGIILSVSRFDNPKGIKREEEIEAELIEQREISLAEGGNL
ncbi:MAG: putative lipid II flippase FtsW [Candidatus Ordinivivax streblomastigis]|uniref:Probable peptidoglycan glycosyltransferase FtsW n=1 Tax=Candidatus Ordinivivax streblomastigis TaxID=2540710 RepID=A0A5M8P2A9_9BACT|nr:MAG: putative lipid II flippase FtsW [Candidatus Ordinivivax streblomastigis]